MAWRLCCCLSHFRTSNPVSSHHFLQELNFPLLQLLVAFENIVSGPEYEELRKGGSKKLNMQFCKDIQARMLGDPNYKFSPELKLKPKSKFVSRMKWQNAQSRRRKSTEALTCPLMAKQVSFFVLYFFSVSLSLSL